MNNNKKINIQSLAKLARLEVSDEEIKLFEEQVPAILSFVARIQEVSSTALERTPKHHSVMRNDGTPHESGIYTEGLLAVAPKRDGGHVAVPQVIKGGKHT